MPSPCKEGRLTLSSEVPKDNHVLFDLIISSRDLVLEMAPVSPIPKRRKMNDPESHDPECTYEPITTLESLLKYTGETRHDDESKHGPCRAKTVALSENFNRTKMKINGQRFQSSKCPKLLVCHDFCGGYLDDKYVNGTTNPSNYTFRHWLQTDIFVYFAHKLVTIPPLGWINSAHRHGVKILGTFITEWTDGADTCDELLNNSETIEKTVEKLTLINEDYGFDGYLINIENPIKNGTDKLVEFVDKLTKSLKNSSLNNSVIWYDSVTEDGSLKWQDELNEKNKLFFDVCDGIYLNYGWTDEKLQNSVALAGNRKYDVFVGVDVFGRGCFGGGGFNTWQAVEKIAIHDLSIAMFAPGWTYETCVDILEYPGKDDDMWDKCAQYFYFSCWNLSEKADKKNNQTGAEFEQLISTDFSRGFGNFVFQLGEKQEGNPWFNLNNQSYQPLLYNFRRSIDEEKEKYTNITFYMDTGCYGGGCIRIKNCELPPIAGPHFQFLSSPDYKIYFPLDISLSKPQSDSRRTDAIALLVIWKKSETASATTPDIHLKICLEVDRGEEGTERIEIHSESRKGNIIVGELGLEKFLPTTNPDRSGPATSVIFTFPDNSICASDKLDGWNLTCSIYQPTKFNSDYSASETEELKSVILGSEGDICIGYFSLAKMWNVPINN